MLQSLKRAVGRSPLGPVARRIRRMYVPMKRPAENPQSVKYDRETVAVMERVLRSDSCCVDVGAHRGSLLREMVRIAPQGTHFAFEPLPHLAAHLRARYPGVSVHQAAVSDQTGTATFVHVENEPAYSGLRPRVYDRPDPVLRSITVDVVRLDEAIPSGLHVAFIKLDIEGGEFHALRGAAQTIARCRPVILFEAGLASTGQYGVGPEDVYQLVTGELGCSLSTAERWLASRPPYSHEEFCHNWRNGPDFFFIAYPAAATA